MKTLKITLQEHGLKATYQRLQVLEYLRAHGGHPTADDIYTELVARNPSLSRTTIYNTIDALKKNGMISTLYVTGNEVRCELLKPEHHHFYCNSCQSIYDVALACEACRTRTTDGHHIDETHGYFVGTCKNCLSI